MRTSKKYTSRELFYYSIASALNQYGNPTLAAKALNLSKQLLNYYKRNLAKDEKGIWRVKLSPRVGPQSSKIIREIRGHGFLVELVIPKFDRWDRRKEYMTSKGIDFKAFNGYERVMIKGQKVWLCNNHKIVYYLIKSFLGVDSREAYEEMYNYVLSLIRETEALLNMKLNKGKVYELKVRRNHYAIVENELAKQYNQDKEKLFVLSSQDGKLRLLIDNSFNLNELENVHPRTAKQDNPLVQKFFNRLMDGEIDQFEERVTRALRDLMTTTTFIMEELNRSKR